MADAIESLIAYLVQWIATGRRYTDVMAAWETSSPHLPIWEATISTIRSVIAATTSRSSCVLAGVEPSCLTRRPWAGGAALALGQLP